MFFTPPLAAVRLALLSGLAVASVFVGGSQGGDLHAAEAIDVEGLFEIIDPPQPTSSPGTVEVLEVFWYRCPHCNAFQPFVQAYLARKPPHVTYRRMPAVLRDSWIPHAKIYLAAEKLGVTAAIHPKVFAAIHGDKRDLTQRTDIRALFVANSVAGADFDDAYDSPLIEAQLAGINRQAEALGVRGVPTVIVNGRYRTTAALAGSYEGLMEVIEVLVEKERIAAGL